MRRIVFSALMFVVPGIIFAQTPARVPVQAPAQAPLQAPIQAMESTFAGNFRFGIQGLTSSNTDPGDAVKTATTTAIQTAIDSLYAKGGGVIHLQAGNFWINAPIYMEGDVHIEGASGEYTKFTAITFAPTTCSSGECGAFVFGPHDGSSGRMNELSRVRIYVNPPDSVINATTTVNSAKGNKITVASTAGISPGQVVTGTSIPSGTYVQIVDASTKVVTLSANLTGAADARPYQFHATFTALQFTGALPQGHYVHDIKVTAVSGEETSALRMDSGSYSRFQNVELNTGRNGQYSDCVVLLRFPNPRWFLEENRFTDFLIGGCLRRQFAIFSSFNSSFDHLSLNFSGPAKNDTQLYISSLGGDTQHLSFYNLTEIEPYNGVEIDASIAAVSGIHFFGGVIGGGGTTGRALNAHHSEGHYYWDITFDGTSIGGNNSTNLVKIDGGYPALYPWVTFTNSYTSSTSGWEFESPGVPSNYGATSLAFRAATPNATDPAAAITYNVNSTGSPGLAAGPKPSSFDTYLYRGSAGVWTTPGTVNAGSFSGPKTAPAGRCNTAGVWVFSQDGHATFCNGTSWVTKI